MKNASPQPASVHPAPVQVGLSLGSNQEAARYIALALTALEAHMPGLQVSPVYESVAIGCAGSNFLNLVVVGETREPLAQLAAWLKQLELAHGRIRSASRFDARTLDIDILFYGELCGVHDGIVLPRPEITENAYVLQPLADVAGHLRHPLRQCSYAALWANYDKARQQLWPVDFVWQGRQLSPLASEEPA